MAEEGAKHTNKNGVEELNLVQRLAEVGISLSAERNINALLEKIVDEAASFTHSDGVTLYLRQDNHLHFSISRNDTLKIRLGGVSGQPVSFPPVPMEESFVSAYAAIHKKTINIPDVYSSTEFDFTGPKKYDEQSGYRSQSMLVTPLLNHEEEVIGVLQLLNALDPATKNVIPFDTRSQKLAESLTSQAAVALNNFNLVKETEHLFESFLAVMATGLDARSKYTSGHVRRVAGLTMELAKALNETTDGAYQDHLFTDDDMSELRIAAWMHDIGKIVSPPHIMDKSVKLETIYDRSTLVKTRYQMLKALVERNASRKKLSLKEGGADRKELAQVDVELGEELVSIDNERDFVIGCNNPGEFMEDDKIQRLLDISTKEIDMDGERFRRLSDDEVKNLSIRKGSLTDEERKIMQDHIVVTIRMLEKIPFSRKLKFVPLYAGSHHECLDGTGYPKGLTASQMPVQSRMLAVTDLFEALTASDRPYKKAMPLEKVYAIMDGEAERGKLDPDLVKIMKEKNVYSRFLEMDKKGKYSVDI